MHSHKTTMKTFFSILIICLLCFAPKLNGQDNGALRVARTSFSSAERNYNNGRYKNALQEFKIVVNSIPVETDSRRHLEMRMDALNYIIEISFYKYVNIETGCQYVQLFLSDIDKIRNSDVLRPSQLLDLLRQEQEYHADFIPRCESYQESGEDIDRFRQLFDEQFD